MGAFPTFTVRWRCGALENPCTPFPPASELPPTCVAKGLPKHGRPEERHSLDVSSSAHHAEGRQSSWGQKQQPSYYKPWAWWDGPDVTHPPCTWAICQWGMFTFLLLRGGKGKVTASPPAKTPSALVCIIWENVWKTMNEGNSLTRAAAAFQHTLLTVMKPLESMWMPLCFRKPVAGTLPAAQSQESYPPGH